MPHALHHRTTYSVFSGTLNGAHSIDVYSALRSDAVGRQRSRRGRQLGCGQHDQLDVRDWVRDGRQRDAPQRHVSLQPDLGQRPLQRHLPTYARSPPA